MTRRTFLCGLTLGTLAAPLVAEAQPERKLPRVAFITTTSPETSTSADAFRQRLKELGYVERQNIIIEWRWGRGKTERFQEFADEVVASRSMSLLPPPHRPGSRPKGRREPSRSSLRLWSIRLAMGSSLP
jgi:putative tryptophan/tyrosine transport system substrate-binding protein